jgi:hypothetical protein
MNIEKLRRSLYTRLRLRPIAISVQPDGAFERHDDVWLLQRVSQAEVELSNISTGHVAKLGTDHIHHFDSDPQSGTATEKHGFLTLTVQVFLEGSKLWLEPVGLR